MKLKITPARTDVQVNKLIFTFKSSEVNAKPPKPRAMEVIQRLKGVDNISAKLFVAYLTACAIEGIHPLDDPIAEEPKILIPH